MKREVYVQTHWGKAEKKRGEAESKSVNEPGQD